MDYTICLHTDTHITPIEAGQNFRWAIVIGKNTQLIIAITHHHFESEGNKPMLRVARAEIFFVCTPLAIL